MARLGRAGLRSPLSVAVEWQLSEILFFIDSSHSWDSSGALSISGFSRWPLQGSLLPLGPKA